MNHKELDVWKSSMMLAELVYYQTIDFLDHEQFGTNNQMRKAAVSVPTNALHAGITALGVSGRHQNRKHLY